MEEELGLIISWSKENIVASTVGGEAGCVAVLPNILLLPQCPLPHTPATIPAVNAVAAAMAKIIHEIFLCCGSIIRSTVPS
jgi:hypothetical protein